MTQATVNVGNAVNNLNPNAQQFLSSDFNHGTVIAGPAAPSDDPYSEYIDNNTTTFIRQHPQVMFPDFLYGVDSSSIDNSQQQQQQQQQSESNFAVHDHAAMLETIDHSQTQILNRNHLQQHLDQTMSEEGQTHQPQFTPERLRQELKNQLEYYFSSKNMVNDRYLISQMDADDFVPIATIANFERVKRLTNDMKLIVDVLKESSSVEVDVEEKKVRSSDEKNRQTRKRCIIILRDVPADATEVEVSELFLNDNCPVSAISCERVFESGNPGSWYVTFNSEDDAQSAFLYLTRENISLRGQKVLARMKTRLLRKPSTIPQTHPSTPVSPPISTNNGNATSPPPQQQQQQQQQQQIQTYSTSTFVSQQQVPPPQLSHQYPSHPQQQQQQQQQFNQAQMQTQQQQQQQQHASMYMSTGTNVHSNPTSILGNIQTQTNTYRPQIHSSVTSLSHPSHHVAPQYSTTNQTQHPSSIDHTQVLSHPLRMGYPSYGANSPFDRAGWQTAYSPNVQTTQPTLSFATQTQQTNIASYPASIHQPPSFMTANHPVYQTGGLLYMPSTYSTHESYPAMSYNSVKTKPRGTTRDHQSTSKLRYSTKPPNIRGSRQEGLPMSNEHSNDLIDYRQHSTPHSEGSSSPVSRTEPVINRPIEQIAQAVPSSSSQHVQSYPTTTVNENIEHFHHPQSTNEILFNNSNSHVQQQGSTDVNPTSPEQINDSQNLGKFQGQSTFSNSISIENSKSNSQPLEQQIQVNENQQQQSNKKPTQQQTNIRPLMTNDRRSTQNYNRSSSSQQGRSQHQQQTNSNSATPLSVSIPKAVSSATYYNQKSSSSPQSPKNQQQTSNDNNGPRTYADMLKVRQVPQQQTETTKSPTNETNDLLSPRAQSPITNATNLKSDSASIHAETNGPLSSASSDLSPSNQTETAIICQPSTNNDLNVARRNSSASDHPQQQQQQQYSSSPSHQHYNNSRGRGGRGGGRNFRYSNEHRSGSNRVRGGGRRSVNNSANSNGPSYQTSGRGRFSDRPRGNGNYYNSNQSVHGLSGNQGAVEPQVHFAK